MINFKFDDMLSYLESIRLDPEPDKLRELANELNLLFKDSTCKGVLYTNNTDKIFFGVYVMPVINPSDIYNIIIDDKYTRINEYYVELDSKLFDDKCGLTAREILAIMIHDISKLINSSSPIELAVKEIDVYLDKTQSYIRQTDNINYAGILTFGFKDLLHKLTSIFCNNEGQVVFENDFVDFCGFSADLISGMMKLKNCEYVSILNQGVERSIIIAWVLKLYDNIKTLRIQTIRGLRKAIAYSQVRLLKNDMKRIITNMERIDDSALLESFFSDLFKKANSSLYKTLTEYEGDYFDLKIQANNVMDEDDALVILHSINTKISIIDNYIDNCDLEPKALNRALKLRENLYKLREDLSQRSLYRKNYRRIYVNYPE